MSTDMRNVTRMCEEGETIPMIYTLTCMAHNLRTSLAPQAVRVLVLAYQHEADDDWWTRIII